MKQDVVVNLVFAAIKAIALMWMIRLAGILFAPTMLGLFLLTRRLSSTGANLAQLGTSQTLLRYVSMNNKDTGTKRGYVAFAVLIWLTLVILGVPALYLFSKSLAPLFFPNASEGEALTFWTGMLLLAMALDFIARSPLIAERHMVKANLVELMNGSIFLILVLLWHKNDSTVVGTLQFQVMGVSVLSLGVVSLYLRRLRYSPWPGRLARAAIGRSFIHYGLPRAVITFVDMGILLIGPWLLRAEVDQAGFLIIALSLLQIFSAAIGPVAQLALVVAARFVSSRDDKSIGVGVRLLFGMTIYAALFVMAVSIPWTEHLVRLWLIDPAVVSGMLPYASMLLWGLLPYAVFQGLKGIIEARWDQPLNLYTVLLGTGLQIVLYSLLQPRLGPTVAIGFSILVSLWAMGLTTLLWARSYLHPLSFLGVERLALVTMALIAINVWLAADATPPKFVAAIVVSLSLIGIFVFRFPTPFVLSCREFILPAKGQA